MIYRPLWQRTLCPLLIAVLIWAGIGSQMAQAAQRPKAPERQAVSRQIAPLNFDDYLAELQKWTAEATVSVAEAGTVNGAQLNELRRIRRHLLTEDQAVRSYLRTWVSTTATMGSSALGSRQEDLLGDYVAKFDQLMALVNAIALAQDGVARWSARLWGRHYGVDWQTMLTDLADFLAANSAPPRPSSFDPASLPHRSLRARQINEPKATAAAWLGAFPSLYPAGKGKGLAALLPDSLYMADLNLPPNEEDLAEISDIQFTPDITQLAMDLNNNPVQIANWVRKNIGFVPTWGSIQGASFCLETKRCNAMDTASLLIALLRVAGIPARYQMGTIDVPADQLMNWAGGFTDLDTAASFFASAGVPSVVRRVDNSGTARSVRLEHVWVRAWIDYIPSGGAVHISGDTWLDIDAAFKQNAYSPTVDWSTAVPTDFDGYVQSWVGGLGLADDVVTNLAASELQIFVADAVDARLDYLVANPQDANSGRLLGRQEITAARYDLLPATLPYTVLAWGQSLPTLPDELRHTFTFTLATVNSEPLFSYTADLPTLGSRSLLLLYKPATGVDEQALVAAIEGNGIIPSTVQLLPQLYLDDVKVADGPQVKAGALLSSQMRFDAPTITTPVVTNQVVAGEVAAIGLDLAQIPRTQVQRSIEEGQRIAELLNKDDFVLLTNHELAKALLANVIQTWFWLNDEMGERMARSQNTVTIRWPSAGLFYIKQQSTAAFGTALSTTPVALAMDVDRDMVVTMSLDGDSDKAARISLAQGSLGSALEAEVPRLFFSTPDRPVQATATMQVLAAAAQQGIPLYQITAQNAATLLPQLNIHPDDRSDIEDGVNAGLTVVVSQQPINFNGRQVLGMIVTDMETGSASYLISGGNNGAWADLAEDVILAITAAVVTVVAGLGALAIGGVTAPILIAGAIIAAILSIMNNLLDNPATAPFFDVSHDPTSVHLLMGLFALVAVIGAIIFATPFAIGVAAIAVTLLILDLFAAAVSGNNRTEGLSWTGYLPHETRTLQPWALTRFTAHRIEGSQA